MDAPLIVTLKLDPPTFEWVNALRQQYFPPARNIVPAHVTLFHALPGEHRAAVEQQLQFQCAQTSSIPLHLPALRFLGQGMAIEVEAPALANLRRSLAERWCDWLTAQDRQGYRPHITLQNKVAADIARQDYEQLAQQWQPLSGIGEGLQLWYYRQGPWEQIQDFPFSESNGA